MNFCNLANKIYFFFSNRSQADKGVEKEKRIADLGQVDRIQSHLKMIEEKYPSESNRELVREYLDGLYGVKITEFEKHSKRGDYQRVMGLILAPPVFFNTPEWILFLHEINQKLTDAQ